MKNKSYDSTLRVIILGAVFCTLISTSWVNKDSLLIPKLITLFFVALFILPKMLMLLRESSGYIEIKYLIVVSVLLVGQIILVTLNSNAPFEQQLFGRTGRGLGIITYLSLIIILISTVMFTSTRNNNFFINCFVVSALISSVYALMQSFGIDFIEWDSRTNGVIGTLGNPNFQSAFAAMAMPTSLVFFLGKKYSIFLIPITLFIFISVIIRTQSIQGIISGVIGLSSFILVILWFKKKILFYSLGISILIFGSYTIVGMLGHGYFGDTLNKVSVQSRGDFWRSALSTANHHPIFGVGLDSFGDYFLEFRDSRAISHPWAEFTDNAHNFFLDYAVAGGYPFMILQTSLILLVLYCFFATQSNLPKPNLFLTAIFSSWVVFQAQSVISPGNIPMMFWNMIISGLIIGHRILDRLSRENVLTFKDNYLSRPLSYFLLLLGLLLVSPYYNADKLQLQAMVSKNGDLAIKAAKMYPESSLRYATLTREFLDAQLYQQALELARSGVEFNAKSVATWVLILVNPTASIEERTNAKLRLLELDPLNPEIKNFEVK